MRLVHSDTYKHSALLLSLLFLGKRERERETLLINVHGGE